MESMQVEVERALRVQLLKSGTVRRPLNVDPHAVSLRRRELYGRKARIADVIVTRRIRSQA